MPQPNSHLLQSGPLGQSLFIDATIVRTFLSSSLRILFRACSYSFNTFSYRQVSYPKVRQSKVIGVKQVETFWVNMRVTQWRDECGFLV